MRKTISYLSATLLCLSGCIATQTAPPSQKPKEKPKSHTYLDEFVYDPYPFVGSVNFSDDGRLIGSGVLISPLVTEVFGIVCGSLLKRKILL